jgi:hypothetical protein
MAAAESSLTPTQRIVTWLEEAHALGTLEDYVDSFLDHPGDFYPINTLMRETAAAARAGSARQPAEDLDRAVRKALRATVFRYDLVLRINVTAHTIEEWHGHRSH